MKTFLWLLLLCTTACDRFETDPPRQYTVVAGDTLTIIAKRQQVSVAELVAWNGLDGDRIDVGQVLRVGSHGETAQAVPKARSRKRKIAKPKARTMPKSKPCLAGPSLDELDDDAHDVQASMGLSMAQIRAPMRAALSEVGDCFAQGWPEAVVDLEITVGCNGRVKQISVVDGGGLEQAVLGCMIDKLGYVGFSAHDMPDGMTFRYPITLSR